MLLSISVFLYKHLTTDINRKHRIRGRSTFMKHINPLKAWKKSPDNNETYFCDRDETLNV